MSKFKSLIKIALQVVTFIIISTTLKAKNLDIYYDSNRVSDYLIGSINLNENDYAKSYKYLKKLDGLEDFHIKFSTLYQYSLINLKKYKEAFNYAKKLEKKNLDNFESNLIIGVYYLKYEKYDLALKYFQNMNKKSNQIPLQNLLSNSLLGWIKSGNIKSLSENSLLSFIPERFQNIKKIQSAFLNCFYDSANTNIKFKDLTKDGSINFSRYNFFYASYLYSQGNKDSSKKVINEALEQFPRNLLLKQFKMEITNNTKKMNNFDCKNISHNIAELFYISANALSSQSMYTSSNFYLSLAEFLNSNFISFKTLHAENFNEMKNYKRSKEIYKKIKISDSVYDWFAAKQIANIMIKNSKELESIKYLKNIFEKIDQPNIYEIYDYAEFLKRNEKFKEAIDYYSKALKLINKNHKLYAPITDGRGVAYERIGEWDKAEKDFLNSLSVKPDQAYVINYLAYSWIEQGVKIEKSLKMLEKANELKKNDGYITDSLGWALFKLKRFKDASKYLQTAVQIMPSDPVVNDHYGDSLWMTGEKLQARYYWNYVLNLEKAEDKLKEKIKNKIIFGLNLKL